MTTGEESRGALIVCANLALCQFVQQEPAGLIKRLRSDNFAAKIAEIPDPLPKVEGELKAAVKLIRNRPAVDPAKLADEAVDLHGLVVAGAR